MPEILIANEVHRPEIVRLLAAENLPTEDLPTPLDHFLIAMIKEKVAGVIGLEKHEEYGLLRSMVVDKSFRNQQIAQELVKALEDYALKQGIKELYLLTLTAADYFVKKGYEYISRNDSPKILQSTSEFTHSCPATAQMMKKIISK